MRIRSRNELGQLMREFRRQRGLTQAQVAEIVGVNRRWVTQVEQGKTSADLRTLLRALQAVGAELHVQPRRESAAADEIGKIIDDRSGHGP